MLETTRNTEAGRADTKSRWPSAERTSLLILAVAAIAYCAWILSLPLFPTQDGPIHLYFVRILQALLFHRDPGIFPQYFLVKHLAPPYALYYYLLLILGHFVSLVTADKLVICLYVVLFLFGFRFLARSLGPSGDAASLLAIPYVLNWPLGMGFVNFCLSLALTCWALGLWCRVAQQPESPRNTRRLVGFAILAWVIMFTHPVPLLFLLGFCSIELCLRVFRTFSFSQPTLRRDAIAFVLAGTTLLYVKAFTNSHVVQQIDPVHKTYMTQLAPVLEAIAIFGSVDAFSPRGFLSVLHRFGIYVLFIAVLMMAVAAVPRSLRSPEWRLSHTFSALALLLWVAIPFLPPDLNNSHLFSSRLMIIAVLTGFAGAGGLTLPRIGAKRILFACSAIGIVSLIGTIVEAQRAIAPVAARIDKLETLPPPPQGIYLALLDPDYARTAPSLTYDPYYWAVARPLRRSNSILFTAPWLDLAIIPIGAQPVLPTGRLPAYSLETSYFMRQQLASSAEARSIIFPPLTGAIINYAAFPMPPGLDLTLKQDPIPSHHWSCAPYAFTALCTDGAKLPSQ